MPVLSGPPTADAPEFSLDLPTRAYLGDSGIVLGDGSVTDPEGCVWKWAPTNAWGPKPTPREQVGDRAAAHGQWDATRFYGPRIMPIPGTCRAPSHGALHLAEQRLRETVTLTPFLLRITEPGHDGHAWVRQQGDVLWTENSHTHASWSINLYSPDPRIYSTLSRSFGPLRFPSISGGLIYPRTYPRIYNAIVVSGRENLVNPGTEPSGLQLRLTGPADDIAVSLPELGQELHLDNPDGPVLRAGEWLIVDTDRHQVRLMGQAERRSWAWGHWLKVPPRSATAIAVTGTGVTAESTLSGSYRSARI